MNTPADIPNPNQDNVFYTIPAIRSELLNYFSVEKVDSIVAKYTDYYLPTFVFDTAGAPHVYNLDVYPKNASRESLQLDSTGSILDRIQLPKPVVQTPEATNLNDGAYTCILDPKFYVDTKLKEPNDISFVKETSTTDLDLLLSTKYFEDSSIEEKAQNFTILKRILVERLKTLPEDELKEIKDLYENRLSVIDDFLGSLQDVKEGQSQSLDTMKLEQIYQEIYNDSSTPTTKDRDKFIPTKVMMAQALCDWNNVYDYESSDTTTYMYRGNNRKGQSITTQNTARSLRTSLYSSSSSGKGIWPKFLQSLRGLGLLDTNDLDAPPNLSLSSPTQDVESVLKYGGVDVFNEEGKPKEWYYQNLQKAAAGMESDWSSLDEYIETVKAVKEPYIQKCTLDVLGGSYLLVDQAIRKAILKLCSNGIDVNEYAPRTTSGTNFFSAIGRSPSLGPAGTTPWPSKYTVDPESYSVKPYTNTGFLCFHALLHLIKRISYSADEESNWAFLVNNIKVPDSDYDSIIKLVKQVNQGGETWNLSKCNPLGNHPDRKTNASLTELMHLYERMEEWPVSTRAFLMPKYDEHLPLSERTFFGWNIPAMEHSSEDAVQGTSGIDKSVWSDLKSNGANMIKPSSGELKLDSLPIEWRNMGYLGQEGFHNKRLFKVNLGIPEPAGLVKNVLPFFEHRQYNTPYFWACMTSLWRGLAVETWRYLIESVNEITGAEINVSYNDIIESFDHVALWRRITSIVSEISGESGLKFSPFVSPDGTISFVEQFDGNYNFMRSIQNRNTPGLPTRSMLHEWVRFVSTVSSHSSVQIVDNHEPVQFDFENYVPNEGLSVKTNLNYSNSHGGGGQYIENSFKPYYDKLEFTEREITLKELIKKENTPVGAFLGSVYTQRLKDWVLDVNVLYQHTLLYNVIESSLENMKGFVSGFSVPQKVQDLIDSGRLNLFDSISNPQKLINQISSAKTKYSADDSKGGLGAKWDWTLNTQQLKSQASTGDWLYVHVLGLKEECWKNSSWIEVVLQYVTQTNVIDVDTVRVYRTSETRQSQMLLNWLHLCLGLDLSETTFSGNLEPIWSDILVNSESGVFPWEKSDFEDNVPKKDMEPLFYMSPWLFPDNMFNDICIPNKYLRIVAIPISRSKLIDAGIGIELLDGKIDDIIGSMRWKVQE